jgi:hypothetical protein
LNAQNDMNVIRANSEAMIAEDGSLFEVIELLEDPEDARHNLKPEIEAIKKSAAKSLETASGISGNFEYWHRVICHLKQTSLSQRGKSSWAHSISGDDTD